jgi:hypothetical protein
MRHTDRTEPNRSVRSEGDGAAQGEIHPDGGLLASLQRSSQIRRELVARNRSRVAAHQLPDPDDVAQRMLDDLLAERRSTAAAAPPAPAPMSASAPEPG